MMVHDKNRRITPEITIEHYDDAADQLTHAIDTLNRVWVQGGIASQPCRSELQEIIAQIDVLREKIRGNRVLAHLDLLCASH